MPEARMELASLIAVEVCSFAAVHSFSWLLALPQYRSLLSSSGALSWFNLKPETFFYVKVSTGV
jgi:hypothetical protein